MEIKGYRVLTDDEKILINYIKSFGEDLGIFIELLRHKESLDQRWVSIGATDLQTGLMALTRAVAHPTTF